MAAQKLGIGCNAKDTASTDMVGMILCGDRLPEKPSGSGSYVDVVTPRMGSALGEGVTSLISPLPVPVAATSLPPTPRTRASAGLVNVHAVIRMVEVFKQQIRVLQSYVLLAKKASHAEMLRHESASKATSVAVQAYPGSGELCPDLDAIMLQYADGDLRLIDTALLETIACDLSDIGPWAIVQNYLEYHERALPIDSERALYLVVAACSRWPHMQHPALFLATQKRGGIA
jgi:hypothetical protein